jgi:dipeptidyl aminopeptidase/acylaminoacyl peptidase
LIILLLFSSLLFSGSTNGQSSPRPELTVEEPCTAIAYAPDGRLAFSVRRLITQRRIEMQRDDVWVIGIDGKRKRIVDGEKLVQGRAPFSYAVRSLRWSPDGRRLTVEMSTSFFTDIQRGETQDSFLTLLLDENGKEIKIQGADSAIPEAGQAAWLADGATVVYLSEAVKPNLLFSIQKVRPAGGRSSRLFADSAFATVAWDAPRNAAVAVERDSGLKTPPQLVLLDLVRETRRELLTLEAFLGKLTISPAGDKVAYFRDHDTLEIRSVAQPAQVATVRVAFGDYQWAPDGSRLLIRRGADRKTSDLLWVDVPAFGRTETASRNALHGLTFRTFTLAHDGQRLAVIEPGKRHLHVYLLP